LPTFKWNQKAFLRNPNLSKFKGIDTKEAYKTALELTSKDMSSYPALLHLDKGIEDEDLNIGCRNPEGIRLGSASNAYAEAYKEYKVVCSEFDFSEDLFKETRLGIEIHTWPHYNLDNISSWGTENDPRFSFFTKVSE
jgi:hypothetical protein